MLRRGYENNLVFEKVKSSSIWNTDNTDSIHGLKYSFKRNKQYLNIKSSE